MSKKRKHKRREENRLVIKNSKIQTYKRRYLELYEQFETTTNVHTKQTIKAQLDNLCDIINTLMV